MLKKLGGSRNEVEKKGGFKRISKPPFVIARRYDYFFLGASLAGFSALAASLISTSAAFMV